MIEPLKISNNPSSAISPNKTGKPVSLSDLAESQKKDDVFKSDSKDEDKKKDRIELSKPAQDILAQQVTEVQSKDILNARKDLKDNAIEFRGYFELSKRRDLTDVEEQRVVQIKDDINKAFDGAKEVTPEEILKIANKTLSDHQQDALTIITKFSQGDVTNTDFAKLDKINKDLNKANGFGDKKLSKDEQNTVDQLNNGFEQILNLPEKRRLNDSEVKILEQVQNQISAIEGYRINVKQSIGIDGLAA